MVARRYAEEILSFDQSIKCAKNNDYDDYNTYTNYNENGIVNTWFLFIKIHISISNWNTILRLQY